MCSACPGPTPAVSVGEYAVVFAFELEKVPPMSRHDPLQIVWCGESVQQRING